MRETSSMLTPVLRANLLIHDIAQKGHVDFARRLRFCQTCELTCPGFADCPVDRASVSNGSCFASEPRTSQLPWIVRLPPA